MTGDVGLRYDGKRALIVGGATGMGAAAAKTVSALGGEVVVMDYAPVDFPVDQAIQADLNDRASIDAAFEQLNGPFDAVFSAAGIADGPKLMRVCFIGHRHLLQRMLDEGKLKDGAAICFISSVAGLGWENGLDTVLEFLQNPDFDSADAWIDAHPQKNNYGFAKQAINAFVAQESYPLMKRHIRINAICPGPTDTPLAQANEDLWLGFGKEYRADVGIDAHTPEQMANAMVFLNSDMASGISGVNLLVDSGHVMSTIARSWKADFDMINFIRTR